jgi:hypothetical protein
MGRPNDRAEADSILDQILVGDRRRESKHVLVSSWALRPRSRTDPSECPNHRIRDSAPTQMMIRAVLKVNSRDSPLNGLAQKALKTQFTSVLRGMAPQRTNVEIHINLKTERTLFEK